MDNKDLDKEIELISDGNRAQVSYELMTTIITNQRKVILDRIVQDFVSAQADLDHKLLSHAASLSALVMQEDDLKAKISKGQRAWEEREKRNGDQKSDERDQSTEETLYGDDY